MSCGSSGTPNVTQQTTAPPPEFMSAYNSLVGRASSVANQPLQQYTGPLRAGFTPAQTTAMDTVANAQGIAEPYINAGSQLTAAGAAPITPMEFSQGAVEQYMSPYTDNVVDATRAQFQNQNEQQRQALIGNAISKGAWGGDRAGVAEGILGGQQALAQAPIIAGLENQGYAQALAEFNAQQAQDVGAQTASGWLAQNAGQGIGNLGKLAQDTTLGGADALLQTGALQQQLAQEQLNIPYQQFLQQQGYPFQTTGWLANIVEGLGGSAGGTGTTTSPGPSTLGQLTGLGITGLGVYGAGKNAGLWGGATGAGSALGSGWYPTQSAADAAAAAAGITWAKNGGRIGRSMGGPITLPPGPGIDLDFIPSPERGRRGSMGPPRAPAAFDEGQPGKSSTDLSSTISELVRSGKLSGGRIRAAGGGAMSPFISGFTMGPHGIQVPIIGNPGGGGGGGTPISPVPSASNQNSFFNPLQQIPIPAGLTVPPVAGAPGATTGTFGGGFAAPGTLGRAINPMAGNDAGAGTDSDRSTSDAIDTDWGVWLGHILQGSQAFTPWGLAAGIGGAKNGNLGTIPGVAKSIYDYFTADRGSGGDSRLGGPYDVLEGGVITPGSGGGGGPSDTTFNIGPGGNVGPGGQPAMDIREYDPNAEYTITPGSGNPAEASNNDTGGGGYDADAGWGGADGNFDGGYLRGGRLRRADGGSIGVYGSPVGPEASVERYTNMPTERLRELAVRYPPQTPQGAIIRRALEQQLQQPKPPDPVNQPALTPFSIGAMNPMAPIPEQGAARGGAITAYADGGGFIGDNPERTANEDLVKGWLAGFAAAVDPRGAAPSPGGNPLVSAGDRSRGATGERPVLEMPPAPEPAADRPMSPGPMGGFREYHPETPVVPAPPEAPRNQPLPNTVGRGTSTPTSGGQPIGDIMEWWRQLGANKGQGFGTTGLRAPRPVGPEGSNADFGAVIGGDTPTAIAAPPAAPAAIEVPAPEPGQSTTVAAPGGGPTVTVQTEGAPGSRPIPAPPPMRPEGGDNNSSKSFSDDIQEPPPRSPGAAPAAAPSSAMKPFEAPEPYKPTKAPKSTVGTLAASPYLALISAGLATMASKSPRALGAIGEGGLQGVKTLQGQAGAEREEAKEAATGEYRAADMNLRAKQLGELGEYHRAEIGRQTARDRADAAHNTATLEQQKVRDRASAAYQQAQINKGYYEPVRNLVNDDGTPKLDANGVPQALWFDRTNNKTVQGPAPDPQVMSASRMGAGAQSMMMRKSVAADLFPNDPTAQRDFIAGIKLLSYADAQKFARTQAVNMARTYAIAGEPPENLAQRESEFFTQIMSGLPIAPTAAGAQPTAPKAAAAPAAAAPPIPQALAGVKGLQWSPSRQQYRDADGKTYDAKGKPVQ